MAERTTHQDPRIRRTRECLRKALIELVLEKDYRKLTVTDLAKRAFVNRSTFYLHYTDIDDLLRAGFEEYWDRVLPGTPLLICRKPTLMEDRLQDVLRSDLEHFHSQRAFYRTALCEEGIPRFRNLLADHLLKVTRQRFSTLLPLDDPSPNPDPLLANWIASAYLGIIRDWLAGSLPGSPAGLAEGLTQLMIHQLQGSRRLNMVSPGVFALPEQAI